MSAPIGPVNEQYAVVTGSGRQMMIVVLGSYRLVTDAVCHYFQALPPLTWLSSRDMLRAFCHAMHMITMLVVPMI